MAIKIIMKLLYRSHRAILHSAETDKKLDNNVAINITFRRVSVNILVVEQQKLLHKVPVILGRF